MQTTPVKKLIMKKIIHTKTELKRQKDHLKRYNRYLPTLYIKKRQLQREIEKAGTQLKITTGKFNKLKEEIILWVALLGENIDIAELIALKEIKTDIENIAGVDVPVFIKACTTIKSYDLFLCPLWVDIAVDVAREMISLKAEEETLQERILLLGEELRVTSQRVNLFEKIKIPETKTAIRQILVFLGDEQAMVVGWARMAKKKMVDID